MNYTATMNNQTETLSRNQLASFLIDFNVGHYGVSPKATEQAMIMLNRVRSEPLTLTRNNQTMTITAA